MHNKYILFQHEQYNMIDMNFYTNDECLNAQQIYNLFQHDQFRGDWQPLWLFLFWKGTFEKDNDLLMVRAWYRTALTCCPNRLLIYIYFLLRHLFMYLPCKLAIKSFLNHPKSSGHLECPTTKGRTSSRCADMRGSTWVFLRRHGSASLHPEWPK